MKCGADRWWVRLWHWLGNAPCKIDSDGNVVCAICGEVSYNVWEDEMGEDMAVQSKKSVEFEYDDISEAIEDRVNDILSDEGIDSDDPTIYIEVNGEMILLKDCKWKVEA